MLPPDDEENIAVNRRGSLVHRSGLRGATKQSQVGDRKQTDGRNQRPDPAARKPTVSRLGGGQLSKSVSPPLLVATEYYFGDGEMCSEGQRSPRDASGVFVLPRRRAAPVGMPLRRSIWSVHSAISHVGVIRQGCGRL